MQIHSDFSLHMGFSYQLDTYNNYNKKNNIINTHVMQITTFV